jgi:hypothetical protein
MSKADLANQNFYSASDQLFDAQIAWEEIYNLLTENDDDYFVTSLYLSPSTVVTGTIAGGSLSTITFTTSLANTGVQIGMAISDSAGVLAAGTTVATITLPSTMTISAPASGGAAGDTFTITVFSTDSNRTCLYSFPLPSDFYRMRLLSYKAMSGGFFIPCQKMDMLNYGYSQNSPAYRLEGQNLMIFDYHMSVYNFWYYPSVQTLATNINLAYPNTALFEYMVWKIAADIRRKQNQDPTIQQSRANDIMTTMKRQIHRDDFRAIKPKDIYSQGNDYWN